jgi:hypothetical protein
MEINPTPANHVAVLVLRPQWPGSVRDGSHLLPLTNTVHAFAVDASSETNSQTENFSCRGISKADHPQYRIHYGYGAYKSYTSRSFFVQQRIIPWRMDSLEK